MHGIWKTDNFLALADSDSWQLPRAFANLAAAGGGGHIRQSTQQNENFYKKVFDGKPSIVMPSPENVSVTLTFESITLNVRLPTTVSIYVTFCSNPFSG